MVIIAHGLPQSQGPCTSNLDICLTWRNPDKSWGPAQIFAVPTGTDSFDSSPSVKWSVVGYNRPETIELLFFDAIAGSYFNTSIYDGRLATASTPTPTPMADCPADVNEDGVVNLNDVVLVGNYLGQTVPPAPPNVDVNGDGVIDINDIVAIGLFWQQHC